jgi:hypothetical protein
MSQAIAVFQPPLKAKLVTSGIESVPVLVIAVVAINAGTHYVVVKRDGSGHTVNQNQVRFAFHESVW